MAPLAEEGPPGGTEAEAGHDAALVSKCNRFTISQYLIRERNITAD